MLLSVGIIERDGGTLYCTAVLIDRGGKLLSTHRKLIPTAAERLVWGQGAGDGLRVVDTELGRVGGLICWENYMPAARLALYQQGIEYEIGTLSATVMHKLTSIRIYIAPNADDLPSWVASMQHIAKEGRCFVVSVNQFCQVSDFPSDYPPFVSESHKTESGGPKCPPETVLSHGGSCIVGPLGTFVAEPVWDRAEIVYADLCMSDLAEGKVSKKLEDSTCNLLRHAQMDFDPVGSYSRPDILYVGKPPSA